MLTNIIRKTWPYAAILGLLAPLLVHRAGHTGIWLDTLFEWSHVPIFGMISLCFLASLPRTLTVRRRFAFAILGSLILSVLSEAAQIPSNRDASWEDIVSDVAGAASFLIAAFAFGKRTMPAATSELVGAGRDRTSDLCYVIAVLYR